MPEHGERLVLTRQEAADLYGVHVNVISAAIHTTEGSGLRAKRIGRAYAIHVDDLAAWWQSLPDA